MTQHQPVLLAESLKNMAIKPDGTYLDATFGRGGHARAILRVLDPTGHLLVMDKDPEAIACACQFFSSDQRVFIRKDSFAKMKEFASEKKLIGKIDAVLMDLGVSSPQLDDADRGFSFMRDGKLDMRMDPTCGVDAQTWLKQVPEKDLANILWNYGEERYSRRIAKAIVETRKESEITTTKQLAEIIKKAHPAWEKGKHPATRSFQAIRIAINNELIDLENALEQALEVLTIGGRLLVISFHSLEDQIVKTFIQKHERGDIYPKGLPIKQDRLHQRLKRIGRAIKPCDEEIKLNPRARSAILRIAEKLS